MAIQLGALRTALLEAGASPEKADKAAEEGAGYENRLAATDVKIERLEGKVNLLQALVSLNIGISIAIALKLFLH